MKGKRCVVFRIPKEFEATGRACLYQVRGWERKKLPNEYFAEN